MPLEFSSLLLRLRGGPNNRAVNSISPPATTPSTNNNPVIPRDSQPLPGTSVKESQLGRKILKDPDSYIDSGVQGDRDAPQGLAPRPRRRSVDGKSAGLKKYRRSHYTAERTPETGQRQLVSSAYMQSSMQPEIKASPSKFGRGRREWSTFGRKRERKSGNVFDLPGHTPQSPRSVPSHSPSSRRHPVQGNGDPASQDDVDLSNAICLSQPSTTSVQSYSSSAKSMRESRGNQSTSRNSSPTSTVSSRRRPRRGHAATVLPAERRFTTPVARRLCFDSPHTFGCPTPHDHRRSPSPPPPLPPLDHPELTEALLARTKASNTKQPVFSNRSNIPSRQSFQQENPVPIMPSNFGISLRNHTSLPGIRHTLESETPPPEPQRRRTRTVSGRPRNQRRDSAEWCSEQAVSGVISLSNQAWPAEVSREILRLSLGEGMDTRVPKRSGAEPLSGSLGEDKSRTRAHDMYHFPHRAPIPPSLFPSSPRERVPSPLKEPVTLPAGRAATTRIKSSSPSLYRHSFGDYSDSSTGPKMAELRSLRIIVADPRKKPFTSPLYDHFAVTSTYVWSINPEPRWRVTTR
ncbi:hypothetical protein SCLCIDRAFT_265859 [Scleroderma citrinum Foug A]|uniref:Uncharacterized protein n=1 Tax=Scleroderma citrinum Foug A TaxID=1036808 RepID=A0A0C3DJ78_9AGAM|nr:hypothetical protein SCLCIDRAFT_265859 [Scleroderma citrinum Foug A]